MDSRNIIIAALALSALVSCGGGGSAAQSDESKLQYSPEVNEVQVVTLRRQDFPRQLLSNGKLSAGGKSSLYFAENGVITRVNVHNGSSVRRGDVIAEQDSESQLMALESARIERDKARLDYLDVLAGLGYSPSDTATAPSDVLALARIRSGYSSAHNSYLKAQKSLAGTVLRAPFSGKIADLKLKTWDRSGSEAFCTVVDDSSFDVNFSALESEYSFLEPGQSVRVSIFGDNAGTTFRGRISAINPVIDKNGQIAVTATIAGNPRLVDGMNVKVVVEKTLPGQLVVPKSAVVIRDGMEVLFRYKAGRAEWVYVNTLDANSESYVVKANADRGAELREGDSIIISGNLNLADGSSVTVRQ